MFCNSDSWDSAICRSPEPRSRPLVMEAFYFLYSPSLYSPEWWKWNSQKFVAISPRAVTKDTLFGGCAPLARWASCSAVLKDNLLVSSSGERRSRAYALHDHVPYPRGEGK